MSKKIRYFGVLLILALLILSSLVYRLPVPFAREIATPEPKGKASLAALQAGNTDGIVVLGVLIFAFIAIPIFLHYRDWRSS